MTHTLRAFSFLALSSVFFAAPRAHAGLADCGNIDVEANAQCSVEFKEACKTKCTAVTFEAACAGQLEASCSQADCKLPSVNCSGSCEGDCSAECTGHEATFSCEGNCKVDCEGTCSGKCTSAANKTECEAQCKATCSGSCQGKCEGQPAQVECAGACHASCQGQCEADTNMQCQIDCQAKGFVDCKAELKGGCEVQCDSPEGAVFCDGEYVDHGGHAQACVDALKAYVNAHVETHGSASCGAGTCQAEGSAKVSCQLSPPASGGLSGEGLALVGIVAGLGAARRKRRAA